MIKANTLRLVETGDSDVLDGFDPRYLQLGFAFMSGCPSNLDCAPSNDFPPPALVEPGISYLAKDYASFRQLIRDQLRVA